MTTTPNQPGAIPAVNAIDADAFKSFEADGWEHQAPTYDDFFGRLTSRFVDPLLDAAEVAPGARVLDLATGPGYGAVEATRRGASVVGVDIAPTMVRLARQLHPDIDFRVADAEALPFEDGSFDAAISNFIVPHLGRPELTVREVVRVLRTGGRMALTTWDQPDRMQLLGVFLDALSAAGAKPPENLPAGLPFFLFADDERFADLLVGAGLTGVEVRTITVAHRVSSSEELWNGMLTGTVRTSALFLAQTEHVRRRIRAEFDRLILEFQRGEQFELPVSVKLAHGQKQR